MFLLADEDNCENYDDKKCDDYDHDVIYDDSYAQNWAAAADGDDEIDDDDDVDGVVNAILMILY